MDLGAVFDRFGKELRDARREGQKLRCQFGVPRFESQRRATRAFAFPYHPRPETVRAVDIGIVGAAVMSTGEGTLTRHAGSRRTRPDRHAAARRPRRLARSVAKAKLSGAIAARTAHVPVYVCSLQLTFWITGVRIAILVHHGTTDAAERRLFSIRPTRLIEVERAGGIGAGPLVPVR